VILCKREETQKRKNGAEKGTYKIQTFKEPNTTQAHTVDMKIRR
jgi:hypothetical protein